MTEELQTRVKDFLAQMERDLEEIRKVELETGAQKIEQTEIIPTENYPYQGGI